MRSTDKAILSIFYGRRIPTEVFVPCRRKKNIKKPSGVFLVGDFLKSWLFGGRKTTDLGKQFTLVYSFLSMLEEKIK